MPVELAALVAIEPTTGEHHASESPFCFFLVIGGQGDGADAIFDARVFLECTGQGAIDGEGNADKENGADSSGSCIA